VLQVVRPREISKREERKKNGFAGKSEPRVGRNLGGKNKRCTVKDATGKRKTT